MTDKELLDWLEENAGCNLISDDGGRWAVSTSGMQPVPGEVPVTMEILSWVEAEEWQPSVREAITFAAGVKEEPAISSQITEADQGIY